MKSQRNHDTTAIVPDIDEMVHDPTISDIDKIKALETLILEAEAGTNAEHSMTLWQGLRTYPKASAWSMLISVAVIMEGEFFSFG